MFELFIVTYVIFGLGLAWYLRPGGRRDLRRRARKPVKAEPRQSDGPHFLIDPETGKLLELPNGWAEMEDQKPWK